MTHVQDIAPIRAQVTTLVAAVAKRDPASIAETEPLFGKDIGLDSIARIHLIFKLDEHFPARMRGGDIDDLDLSTVASIVAFLAR